MQTFDRFRLVSSKNLSAPNQHPRIIQPGEPAWTHLTARPNEPPCPVGIAPTSTPSNHSDSTSGDYLAASSLPLKPSARPRPSASEAIREDAERYAEEHPQSRDQGAWAGSLRWQTEIEKSCAYAKQKEVLRESRFRSLRPCRRELDGLYGTQSLDDPDIVSLIGKSIREHGVTDPIRISTDNVIISGHRCRLLCDQGRPDRTLPVIVEPISYKEDRDAFLRLLVEANEQRKKSAGHAAS